MIIEAKVLKVGSLQEWDISDIIIGDLKWTTEIKSSFPGRLSIKIIDDEKLKIDNGDIISLKIDGINQFKGMVRNRRFGEQNTVNLTVYDHKFLLKSKDTYNFGVMTASERFSIACDLIGIPSVIRQGVTVPLGDYICDGKSMYEVIQDGIDETYTRTGQRYAIKDSFGTLEFFSLNHLVTPTIVGDDSLVQSYDYENSIEDIINSIKVIKEDSETNERVIANAKDSASVQKYGLIQEVDKPENDEMNQAQMQEQAETTLKENNKEQKTLSMTCTGHFSVVAGNTVQLKIKKLESEGLYDKPLLVTKCTHIFGEVHIMDLELEVV